MILGSHTSGTDRPGAGFGLGCLDVVDAFLGPPFDYAELIAIARRLFDHIPRDVVPQCASQLDPLKEGSLFGELLVDYPIVRDHAKVGNHVKLGTRDAGIMWNGVAKNFADDIEIVEVPYEYDAEVGVSIMGLSYTKNKAQVEKFLDFAEKHGKEVFAEFGYVKD